MRTLVRLNSLPDFFVTPYFRSTRTTCAMSEGPMACITENPSNAPVWAQLAGSESAALVRDARALLCLPIAGINLNVGCPSPLVNRHGAGAGLLRDIPRLREVCLALREIAPPGQFSIKCRIGWSCAEEFPELLEIFAESRPDMLMVHARTRQALYGGNPLCSAVAMAVQRMECPVLGNGDIGSFATAAEWMEEVRPAGLMCGRGAVRNPFLFRELRGGASPTKEEMTRYYMILMEETGRTLRQYKPAGHCNRMKKYLAYCYKDLPTELEHDLRRCTDPERMAQLLSGS